RPDRIEQNVEACDLEEKARMPDIGNPAGGAVDPRGRPVRMGRRRPGRPFCPRAAPEAIDQPAVQLPAAPWRHALGVEKTLAVEVIGDRTGVIAGHLPRIISFAAAPWRA